MKPRFTRKVLLTASMTLSILAQVPTAVQAQGKAKALEVVVKLLVGAAAAESLSRSGQSYEQREILTAQAEQESETLKHLRSQGVKTDDTAIYSALFNLDTNSSAVYWADFFSKADVFFIVDIEGQGSFLIPQIRNNYQGGPILDRVLSREIVSGRRVVVRIMDDDTLSDEIWKTILRTRAEVGVSAQANAMYFVPCSIGGDGRLRAQLLSDSSSVVVDASDHLASMTFVVPTTSDGRWVANGELLDGSNRKVGTMQFISVWSANGEVASREAALKQTNNKKATSTKSMIFWGAMGFVLLSVFLSSVLKPAKNDNPSKPEIESRTA